MIKKNLTTMALVLATVASAFAQTGEYEGKFEQLGTELRSPNMFRTASGAPGPNYWQQQADYEIDVTLDEEKLQIIGSETITYTNNSPDPLRYLWVQLDQNMRAEDSDTYKTEETEMNDEMGKRQLQRLFGYNFDGGHKIQKVTDANGNDLAYTINWTMMRVDLPEELAPGGTFEFNIDWYYNINDRNLMGGRGGYEYFPEDGNHLFTITQWFPRMAVYSDFEGWQHKQFMGRGEFALTFGDYRVRITVPEDHVVCATGTLQNPEEVLSDEERQRLEEAWDSDRPVEIVTLAEAKKAEKRQQKKTRTWEFFAEDVRDFAFGSSRKYIWDAMGVDIEGGERVWAMSYYPKEAYALYRKYSTEVVAHTLQVYSKFTIPYPYPKAISVEASNGMEYPMICFNYGRTEDDGTYSERVKYGMIGVIIHEVGHNFFPMIVNSDERQWTWMDEGLNTFVQFLTEQEWDHDYPSRRGPAYKIAPYMGGDPENIRPIMTNSEQIRQFGANAYAKPATALNILRETVMGRELFDYAFKEYSRRWAFRHPTPDDFFRTMEDASGVDLDWFWKGWFYSIDHVDIAITNMNGYKMNTMNPDVELPMAAAEYKKDSEHISRTRNMEGDMETVMEARPDLRDFYNSYDRFEVRQEYRTQYRSFTSNLDDEEKELMGGNWNFYELTFDNIGGLVMPIILEWTYADGTTEVERIPAEIWRKHEHQITKVFPKQKEVVSVRLDPYRETADTDEDNNYWPPVDAPSRFELYQQRQGARGA
ncbi:MAG TPA: aminopeptidase, partial [Cytophagales bacterium]|nr:aminopeptidase [Cytophagales bacterium]